LTKGQYSPTSKQGQVTKTSPLGVLETPFNPVHMAIASGAPFVARGYDKDRFHIQYLIERAARHKGFSFVELLTNCLIFNDEAFDDFTKKDVRDDNTVNLEHGKPLVFGKEHDKGIILDGFKLKAVTLGDEYSINDLLVHDETDSTLAYILAGMDDDPELPHPVGVFLALDKKPYDERVTDQIAYAKEVQGEGTLEELLLGDDHWEVN
jgi:2-oxoglutarate ferredoxin oxidoreductase subunit beta